MVENIYIGNNRKNKSLFYCLEKGQFSDVNVEAICVRATRAFGDNFFFHNFLYLAWYIRT